MKAHELYTPMVKRDERKENGNEKLRLELEEMRSGELMGRTTCQAS
jgi:hypothetical protein